MDNPLDDEDFEDQYWEESSNEQLAGGIAAAPLYMFTLAANSNSSLEESIAELEKNILSSREDSLPTLECYTRLATSNLKWKAALIGSSKAELLTKIQHRQLLRGHGNEAEHEKICFLFPGFTAAQLEETKPLYEASTVFRTHFDYCMEAFRECLNVHGILTIFSAQYALLKLWENWGVKPDYVLGHSLGEFAAAISAEILTVDEVIMILTEIDRQLSNLPPGSNVVVRANKNEIVSFLSTLYNTDQLEGAVEITVINSETQSVVVGKSGDIETFSKFCSINGIKCTNLPASFAIHSSYSDPIVRPLHEVTSKLGKRLNLEEHSIRPGFISSIKGRLLGHEELNGEYWARLPRDNVVFTDSCKTAINLGCDMFVEIGQHPILSSLMMENAGKDVVCLPSLKKGEGQLKTLLGSLGRLYVHGVRINWTGCYNI